MKDPHRPTKNGRWLARRDFLKGSGAAAAATALAVAPLPGLTAAEMADDAKVVAMGPDPVKVELTVNGKKMSHSVEPRVTLLDTLRNHLDVTGCKRVCDRGTCGACTVMLVGKPIYSCTKLAVAANGRDSKQDESLVYDETRYVVSSQVVYPHI